MTETRPSTPSPAGPGEEANVVKRRVVAGPVASAKSMADMLVGTMLDGRYKLVEKLGEGAMGWVFLAEHIDLRKRFAVKVLRPSLCRMPDALGRFRREARVATSIGSRHIVDITDFGQTESGAAYFVMEYLRGEDLGTLLRREKRLPWPRVQHIVLQLCDALQAAHDAGIVHRDVKPANFHRTELDGDPDFIKVLDFGIARLANPSDGVVTQTGLVMGTPDFMAPEQARGRKVDHRADVYSLGACAYALVTGHPPFSGKNEYDVIRKLLSEEPTPLREACPETDVPPHAEAAIAKALRKNPDERLQSMRQFADALRGVDAAEPSSKPSAASATRPRHATATMWLLVVVAVLAVAGLVYAFAG